jgi:hypothetical protein
VPRVTEVVADKLIANNATVVIVAANCYRRSMATSPTIPRTDLQRVLPTFRKVAALIDVHPSFVTRAVRDLGIAPVQWGRRERYLQIPDVLLIATHARRNSVEEVAGGLVELAELQAPELAGWVTTEAEQFLAALPESEPEESDTFLAELRSELPGKWADRAEAIYRRHLND